MIKDILEDLIKQLQYFANDETFLKDAEEFYSEFPEIVKNQRNWYVDPKRFPHDFRNAFLIDMVSQIYRPSSEAQGKMMDDVNLRINVATDWSERIHYIEDI